MSHRMQLVTLSLALFAGGSIASPAQALPPDPTNTCGGNGACQSEAEDVEYWDDAVDDLVFEVEVMLNDLHGCEPDHGECWASCTNSLPFVDGIGVFRLTGEQLTQCLRQCDRCDDLYGSLAYLLDQLTYVLFQMVDAHDDLEACLSDCD